MTMTEHDSMLQALERIDAEVAKRNGFTFRATGMLHSSIQTGQQFMLVRLNTREAEPIFSFQVTRNIVPGVQHFAMFMIPESNPDSRIVIPSDAGVIGARRIKV
jgi:hypothetical protein